MTLISSRADLFEEHRQRDLFAGLSKEFSMLQPSSQFLAPQFRFYFHLYHPLRFTVLDVKAEVLLAMIEHLLDHFDLPAL
eukprot:Skav218167  [mRNA]  locus=scaffold5213:119258:119643:+ [translate_table: standard]